MDGNTAVGHVPRNISAACYLFLDRDNTAIYCTITRDLPQGGLEVPCVLKLDGEANLVTKIKKAIATCTH